MFEVSGQLHVQAELLSGTSTRYQLDRRLVGPESQSAQHVEEKIPFSFLWGLEPCPIGSSVRVQSLYRLVRYTFNIPVRKRIGVKEGNYGRIRTESDRLKKMWRPS
jgi:hypothetical protein